MHALHENRTGRDRRQVDLPSRAPRDVERRWNRDQRTHAVDEEAIYDCDAGIAEDYWESLFKIPTRY